MELNHGINFNDPIEVTEIFRTSDKDKETGEQVQHEFGSRACFGWEDVMFVKEYPFDDTWEKYHGPKYYIRLRGYEEMLLVYGEYEVMFKYWTQFRNEYPMYKFKPDEEDSKD